MSTTLPGIGRNGLVNSIRRLSGTFVPGYRDVDDDATFIAGQVVRLNTVDGVPKVANVTAVNQTPIGIAFCHKTTYFYRPVFREAVTFTGAGSTINLANANLLNGSVLVEDAAGTDYAVTTDYTLSLTNGTITQVPSGSGGSIGATETVYVSYRYTDPNLSGVDQTLGSGKAAVLEGKGEVATLVYDTTAAYVLGASVYFTTAGLITGTDAGSATVIGKITKAPTASDPELYFKMDI